MCDDVKDKGIQTTVIVYPHVLTPEEAPHRIRVRCNRSTQTEAQLPIDASSSLVLETLKYTPYADIAYEAVAVQEIPRKFILTFDDNIIEHLDENSLCEPIEQAPTLQRNLSWKSNLRKNSTMEAKKSQDCQTELIVRPAFLNLDEVAQVICDLQVQTSMTFTPDASMERVNRELHMYYNHNPSPDVITTPPNTEESDKSPEPGDSIESMRNAVRQLNSREIEEICAECCSEEEVLDRIKCWYVDVKNLVDESEPECDEFDEITGQEISTIEAEIILSAAMIAESLDAQAERMLSRYSKAATQDEEIQCFEYKDHIGRPGRCTPQREKSCTCDCQQNAKGNDPKTNTDMNSCVQKLQELCELMQRGGFSGRLDNVLSSPALISCPCPKHHTSGKAKPSKARACTNRKCNCLSSKGCRPCEKALRMQKKIKDDPSPPDEAPKPVPTTSAMATNLEMLLDIEGDYADEYIEYLGQEDVRTQTDDDFEPTFDPCDIPDIPEGGCTCLRAMEMPWDSLVVRPLRKRSADPSSAPKPARNDDEVEGEESEEGEDVDEDEESTEPAQEEEKQFRRLKIKPTQVFAPDCESYHEPYMERIVRGFCELEQEALGKCTSHVEIPWDKIELPQKIILRKGPNPCIMKRKAKSEIDPCRKCGPWYRKNHPHGALRAESGCGIPSCRSKSVTLVLSSLKPKVPPIKSSSQGCVCDLCKSIQDTMSGTKQQEGEKQGKDSIISCLKKTAPDVGRETVSAPTITNCLCNPKGASSKSTKSGKASQSRTERIAALLDSCKREMEPIKDGINQLRARIKELNIPDLMAYNDQPQQLQQQQQQPSAACAPPCMNYMGMCYPPTMVCYPYPPPFQPPSSGLFSPGAADSAQVSRIPAEAAAASKPSSSKKCKCKSKCRYPKTSSSYLTTSETSAPVSSDYSQPEQGKSKVSPSDQKAVSSNSSSPESEGVEQKASAPTIALLAPPSPQSGQSDRCDPCNRKMAPVSQSNCLCAKSKIPRPASTKKAPTNSFPSKQQITPGGSAFKSCKSTLSEAVSSCPSKKCCTCSPKQQKTQGSSNSLMCVESCATQKSPSSKQIMPQLSSVGTTCKIRFQGKPERANHNEVGIEVKSGRPVENSSGQLSCKPSCKSSKSSTP